MAGTQVMSRTVATGSKTLQLRLQAKPIPPIPKDVVIDYWVSKIFSIISSGPAGGFVRFAINPRNELLVDRTGNRGSVEEIVSDLLPTDACRFVAYKLKYRRYGNDQTRIVWFVWTPESATKTEPTKYLNGLASTLIGLKCSSTIPILNGKTPSDLDSATIMSQV